MTTGFWHLSSTMMFDQIGQPAGGAEAFFYPADTLTQLVVYKDSGLTIPWSQPVAADGFGRMPNVYLDGSAASYYRFRVTDDTGVELIALATIPILVPGGGGGGGGGGGSVDATTILNTGDMFFQPAQAVRAGAVRCNGRTIGNAVSGGSERANADTQALFLFLFQNLSDTVCPVSGGRTTAAADFAANKRIGLPDLRGRSPFGLDGMGTTLAGVIPVGVIAANDTPGSSGGSSSHFISIAEMPTHLHGVGTIVAGNESAHTHSIDPPSTATGTESADHTHGPGSLSTGNNNVSHTHGPGSFAAQPTGSTTIFSSGSAHVVMSQDPAGLTANSIFITGTSDPNSVPHTHSVTGGVTGGKSATHTHNVDIAPFTSGAGSVHTHTLSGSTANAGLGNQMINLSPAFLGTWLIKL